MSHAKYLRFRSIEQSTRPMTINVHFFPSQTPFLAYPPKTPGVNQSTNRDQIAQSYYSLNQRGLLIRPGLSRYMTNAYRNIPGAAQTLLAPPLPLPALPCMLLPRALTFLRCVTHIPGFRCPAGSNSRWPGHGRRETSGCLFPHSLSAEPWLCSSRATAPAKRCLLLSSSWHSTLITPFLPLPLQV